MAEALEIEVSLDSLTIGDLDAILKLAASPITAATSLQEIELFRRVVVSPDVDSLPAVRFREVRKAVFKVVGEVLTAADPANPTDTAKN